MKTATERNAHYGRLNRRFDKRAALLIGMGFKTMRLEEYNISIFIRTRYGKKETIANSFVMNADKIVWEDRLVILS